MMARDRDGRFASAIDALDAWHDVCKVMGDLPRRSSPRSQPSESADDEAHETVGATVSATYTDAGPSRRR